MISASDWVREASKVKGKDIAAFVQSSKQLKENFSDTVQVFADLDWNKINAFQAFALLQTIVLPFAIKEAQAKEKNWIVRLFSNGKCIREEKFSQSFEAEHWADLRLFDASSDSYAEVFSYQVKGTVTIYRSESIERIMKKPAPMACKLTAKRSSRLSFGPKPANQKKFYFSRG